MRPIFILADVVRCSPARLGVPDHDLPVREWETICHGQESNRGDFLFITYSPFRATSRWVTVEKKKPFEVHTRRWHKLGESATLAGAVAIAKREA